MIICERASEFYFSAACSTGVYLKLNSSLRKLFLSIVCCILFVWFVRRGGGGGTVLMTVCCLSCQVWKKDGIKILLKMQTHACAKVRRIGTVTSQFYPMHFSLRVSSFHWIQNAARFVTPPNPAAAPCPPHWQGRRATLWLWALKKSLGWHTWFSSPSISPHTTPVR